MQVEGKIALLQGVTKPELVEVCLALHALKLQGSGSAQTGQFRANLCLDEVLS